MNKLFMLTRGRTGSSAVLDELASANVFAHQELVADFSSGLMKETLKEYIQSVPPLDIWKEIFIYKRNKAWGDMFVVAEPSLTSTEKLLFTFIRILNAIAPTMLNNNRIIGRKLEQFIIDQYLGSFERQAIESGKASLIFKVLTPNIISRRSLLEVLRNRGYRAILLVRRNIVKKVLSGMIAINRSIAEKRNMYYSRNNVGEVAPCAIDLDKFEQDVYLEISGVEKDRELLTNNGISYLEVAYEDFCDNREKFYSEIFSFMGIETELPSNTDFSIMVPDMRKAVTNFNELEARVNAMGMKEFL